MSNMTDLWLSGVFVQALKLQNSFSAGAPPRGPRWGSLRRSR